MGFLRYTLKTAKKFAEKNKQLAGKISKIQSTLSMAGNKNSKPLNSIMDRSSFKQAPKIPNSRFVSKISGPTYLSQGKIIPKAPVNLSTGTATPAEPEDLSILGGMFNQPIEMTPEEKMKEATGTAGGIFKAGGAALLSSIGLGIMNIPPTLTRIAQETWEGTKDDLESTKEYVYAKMGFKEGSEEETANEEWEMRHGRNLNLEDSKLYKHSKQVIDDIDFIQNKLAQVPKTKIQQTVFNFTNAAGSFGVGLAGWAVTKSPTFVTAMMVALDSLDTYNEARKTQSADVALASLTADATVTAVLERFGWGALTKTWKKPLSKYVTKSIPFLNKIPKTVAVATKVSGSVATEATQEGLQTA